MRWISKAGPAVVELLLGNGLIESRPILYYLKQSDIEGLEGDVQKIGENLISGV
jgi:hypothetical protein